MLRKYYPTCLNLILSTRVHLSIYCSVISTKTPFLYLFFSTNAICFINLYLVMYNYLSQLYIFLKYILTMSKVETMTYVFSNT